MSKLDAVLHGVLDGRILATVVVPIVVMAALFTNETAWVILLISLIAGGTWEAAKILRFKVGDSALYGRQKYFYMGIMWLVGMMLLSYVVLRNDPNGLALCFQICWLVWSFDVFALIGGTTFASIAGRTHKIMPSISPKKSWEGFFVGLVVGLLSVYLSAQVLKLLGYEASLTLPGSIIPAILALTFGHLGDFLESWFKRWAGVKDSSHLLGGHGGILDRFDSFTFVGAAFLLFRVAGWI